MTSIQINAHDAVLPIRIRDRLIRAGYNQVTDIGSSTILKNTLTAFFCSTKCTGEAVLRTFEAVRKMRDAGCQLAHEKRQ